jgi:hypothetical protein
VQLIHTLPFFPLDLILFPGEQTALHLFEPRYKALLNDIEAGDGQFAIPYPELKGNFRYASVVELVSVTSRNPTGESDIIIEGKELGRVKSFQPEMEGKLYAGGQVRIYEYMQNWVANTQVQTELALLAETLGKKAEIFATLEYRQIMRIMTSLQLPTEQKHRFLRLNSPDLQQQFLADLLRFSRFIVLQEQKMVNGFFLN